MTKITTCDKLETPPDSFESAIFIDEDTDRRTILVTPRGDERPYRGKIHHTFPFSEAIPRLTEGTTVRLLPGKYYRAVDLVRSRGSEEKPIIIEGTLDANGHSLTHICGTNAAGSVYPKLPDQDDYAFLKLRECEHIVIRHLRVESCWPSFLYAERTSSVTVDDIVAQDGTYLIFVRGPEARGFTIKNCHWTQDPTATMWSAIEWEQSHHGLYAYYNGALIGGVDVHGDLEIAENVVDHAYNGIRFTTTQDKEDAIRGRFNVNVRIHGNQFSNIRDNVIEPEKTALNWHISDNRIKNTHAPFSIHDLYGGYIYIYGNEIFFDDRGGADYQGNRGGKIYKLRRKGPLPDRPIHIFHNSLFSRTFLIKRARSRHLLHRNNAVQFCDPRDFSQCLCLDNREFLQDFPIDENEQPLPWDSTVVFDGDASNREFSRVLCRAEQEAHGIIAPDLEFADSRNGDFTPLENSVLRNSGHLFTLSSEQDLPAGQPDWPNWPGEGKPHIGAVQEKGKRISLPFHPISLG